MPEGSMIRTIALVAAIATGAAVLVTGSWEFSRDRIVANERARLLEELNSVLDEELAGRELDPVLVSATDPELLGRSEPIDVFIPMDGDQPVAAIFASVAPKGYNAPINLLIGIATDDARIMGVRVVGHRETPGLGDLIELRKSNWILQFTGKSLTTPAASGWAVRKDEGDFDSITGATVTPRAVVEAVHDTLLYFDAHKEELFAEARRVKAEERSDASP